MILHGFAWKSSRDTVSTRNEGVIFAALGLGKTIVDGEKSLRFSPKYPKILSQYYSVKSTINNSQNKFYALDMNKGKNPLKYGEAKNLKKYGGEDTDLSIRLWEKFPNQFVFSNQSPSIHFQRRTLEEFCNQLREYGENNFLLLAKKYPNYSTELGTDLINSFRGVLIFNPIIKIIIKLIYLIFPFQIVIRYMVIDSVICGARNSAKIKTYK